MAKPDRAVLLTPGASAGREQPALVAVEKALAPVPVERMDFPYRKAGRRSPDKPEVLIAAGLIIKSVTQLNNVKMPFAIDSVLTARVDLPRDRYPDSPASIRFFEQLLPRLQARMLRGTAIAVSNALANGELEAIARARYALIVTYRRDGTPVATPVPTISRAAAPAPTLSRAPASKPAPLPVRITFPAGPASGHPGQVATLGAHYTPGVLCTIVVHYKSGPSKAQGLGAKRTDGSGNVSWSWIIGTNTTHGQWPITVTCGSASAQSYINVI